MNKWVGASMESGRRQLLLASGTVAVAAALFAAPAPAADISTDLPDQPAPEFVEKDGLLSDGALREAVATGEAPPGATETAEGAIVVEVLFRNGEMADARSAIREADGSPQAGVPGTLIQAEVPISGLEGLEADPAVKFVRLPLDYAEPVAAQARALDPSTTGSLEGEQVLKTNADAWHAAGIDGSGIKVGIIDGFDQAPYNNAVAAGEIPAVSGTICLEGGAPCDIFAGGTPHGVGVAEVVADMAPGAQLYFASAITASDTDAVLDYFAAQGVDVVTRSQTGRFDGPGNGTGPIADVISGSAVGQNMFYLNSAGNSGGRNGRLGSYYRGTFADGDVDGWHEFAPGDEYLGYNCSYQNGLRWNDWGEGAAATDYDLYLYNSSGTLIQQSVQAQGGGGTAPPLELAGNCNTSVAFIRIFRYATNGGDTNDTLEFGVNGAGVEYFSNPFSAAAPMADLNSPGAVAVGAIDPPNGVTIADYSSEGPTNDNRIKPDLSAAACVQSLSYSPQCFNGTSSSTPVVAGGAALALDGGAANSPATLKTFLLNSTVDRGAGGPDNVYGRGELVLPDPGADTLAPNTLINSGPDNGATVTSNSVTFSFSGEPSFDTASLQCKLDGASWAACTSPRTFSGLADGSHTFSARAIDAVGNFDASPATRTFTVDTSGSGPGDTNPPVAEALPSKGKSGKSAKLKYRVTDDGGSSSETIVISKRAREIATLTTEVGPATGATYVVKWGVPKNIKGKLKFCVTARDLSGNASTESCAQLKIKKKKKRRKKKR